MRRRISLKVLYWPSLASTSVMALLLVSGPPDHWAVPHFNQDLAGFGFRLPWQPDRLTEKPGDARQSLAASGSFAERSDRVSPRIRQVAAPAPRTLLVSPLADAISTPAAAGIESRSDRQSLRASGPATPSVGDRAAVLRSSPLANAELRAPRLRVEDELAGLDTVAATEHDDSRTVRFLTVANPSAVTPSATHGGHLANDSSQDRSESRNGVVDTVGHRQSLPTSTERSSRAHGYVGDQADEPVGPADSANRSRHGLGGGWPETPRLIDELRSLGDFTPAGDGDQFWASTGGSHSATITDSPDPSVQMRVWRQDVAQQLAALRRLPSIASPASAELLARLEHLARQGIETAELVEDRAAQIACLRAAHSVNRRVVVWQAAHQATVSTATPLDVTPGSWTTRDSIQRSIAAVAAEIATTSDADGWHDFLLLDELAAASGSDDPAKSWLVAQRFLSRLNWPGLSDSQIEWLQQEAIAELAASIRGWAIAPVDYAALLGQLERQESDAIDLGGIDVARAAQSLRFASSSEAQQLASTLNTHYRNANLRVAVSDRLINRIVPEVDSRIEPVRQRILGADVRGHSRIDSAVAIRLIPSPSTWRLELETTGEVHSDTASRNGPVSIRSGSAARFASLTPLEISSRSAGVEETVVSVDSTTRVRGIDTDFDSIPLVGSLVREIAKNRYQSLAPTAKQIQHGKIRGGVSGEIDSRLDSQLDEASDKFSKHLVGPLASLGLNPMVVDMQTTADRLVARYRVGSDWQLAAFTPRPRAPGNSLISLQVHQSAVNNTLEAVLPAGESISIREIADQLRGRFAIPTPTTDGEDDEELPDDILIQFASTRPVTVEVEDDVVWITLRVMRLHREAGLDLRRFIVRAAYRCDVDGLSASLSRDGHLRISGPGMSMRERLPVRAIFNKVFSSSRPIPLVPAGLTDHPAMAGLQISQLELRDGWIGLAIGPAGEPLAFPGILPTGPRVAAAE